MNTVRALHREAMDFAQLAFVADLKGKEQEALELNRKAFKKEAQAANLLFDDFSLEPTRSVLQRSAAVLAMECGELEEAEGLIDAGLLGQPPAEIAQELRDLLQEINSKRDLRQPSTESTASVVVGADDERASITMAGALRFADSLNGSEGQIKIVDQNGKKHSIIVPLSMMSSIVKPLYEEHVMVTGVQAGGVITLKNIVKVEEALVMA